MESQQGNADLSGAPVGLLRTEKEYENYMLTLEWRWSASIAGDSGVFVHVTEGKGAFGNPRSIEVSLFRDNAGDLMAWGPDLTVANEERRNGHVFKKLIDDTAEQEMGEWNRLEVTCKGQEIIVKVNNKLVNHATNSSVTKGSIGLQSQGTPVFFRNVKLTPISKPVPQVTAAVHRRCLASGIGGAGTTVECREGLRGMTGQCQPAHIRLTMLPVDGDPCEQCGCSPEPAEHACQHMIIGHSPSPSPSRGEGTGSWHQQHRPRGCTAVGTKSKLIHQLCW